MTTLGLEYLKHTEAQRANKVRELETHRSNLAQETETHRANVAKEGISLQQNAETHRANMRKEYLDQLKIEETNRANLAKEAENYRSNKAQESIKQQQLAEDTRKNTLNYTTNLMKANPMAGMAGMLMPNSSAPGMSSTNDKLHSDEAKSAMDKTFTKQKEKNDAFVDALIKSKNWFKPVIKTVPIK